MLHWGLNRNGGNIKMTGKKTIYDILAQREEFLVIGLTGRMGSGCTSVAKLLESPFDNLHFPSPTPQPGMESLSEEERTVRIIADYAERHWIKFDIIQVSAIIASFILDDDTLFFSDIDILKKETLKQEFFKALFIYYSQKILEIASALPSNRLNNYFLEKSEYDKLGDEQKKTFLSFASERYISTAFFEQEKKALHEDMKIMFSELKTIIGDNQFNITLPAEEAPISWWNTIAINMNELYQKPFQIYPLLHRRLYLECLDKILLRLSVHYMLSILSEYFSYQFPASTEPGSTGTEPGKEPKSAEDFWQQLKKINCEITSKRESQASKGYSQFEKYVFVKYFASWLREYIRNWIINNISPAAYTRLFQRYGQIIRYYSSLSIPNSTTSSKASGEVKQDIFAIPRRINQYIKVLRHPFDSQAHRPVRIVIDSIKNVFEAIYLRYRYSAFYLWAITTEPAIRENRLRAKHFTDTQVRMMDWNEYPDQGKEIISKVNKFHSIQKNLLSIPLVESTKSTAFLKNDVTEEEEAFFYDSFAERKNKEQDYFFDTRNNFFLDNSYPFYTQDIDACVSNSDVYLFNNSLSETDIINNTKLLVDVVRNVCLALYPCLVRPTPIERCMQIAMSAKVNSGCLSRQVGAVVTDSQYNILSIGWNDVPLGEIPCAYRSVVDICSLADRDAYSEFELDNINFRDEIKRYKCPKGGLLGLPFCYCFKDAHKNTKDPMRSRAMHGEEKALALCGREAEGGFLFTTSSPCEMCSKNAKNHKIKKIYYIEAYPGISQAQYTNSGDKNNRAELILFSGAVGRAYMQMYTPLLPHKDVLEYLGVHKE